MEYKARDYDVAVIGAGHAGCEAALASARLGFKTLLFSISLECIANMPCNPHIGGSAKGHIVREIDALGGEMARVTDKAMTQIKLLNVSKGPAVHALRAQADRKKYHEIMKKTLERQPNLYLKQAEITQIEIKDNTVKSVLTDVGARYNIKKIIVATRTYLNGKIFIGDYTKCSGPDGVSSAKELSKSFLENNIELKRFKTGTPARINRRSIDFSDLEVQKGDQNCECFSFENEFKQFEQLDCYLTYTNENTHKIIRDNIHRSPLYSGLIDGIGPRYCPSIEDKVVRFADKQRHQAFIEPVGYETDEMYIQGISSSLPEDVQLELYHSMKGLENAEFTRPAYAIEYDCINPNILKQSLETKTISRLYFARQVNGTSGYEEAAAQGLIAGINAARSIENKEPLILDRSQAYIGVLIDDITTKRVDEPYRMMTSRAEYRLVLRQDNADLRLTKIGHDIGLISDQRYEKFKTKKENIEKTVEILKHSVIKPTKKINEILRNLGTPEITNGYKASEILKRSEVNYTDITKMLQLPELNLQEQKEVELIIKYEGYIKLQEEQINKFKKLENELIPDDIDYDNVKGLSIESIQNLKNIKPRSIGQASRISGISPADINVLLILLKYKKNKKNL